MILSQKDMCQTWLDFAYGLSYLSGEREPGGDEGVIFDLLDLSFSRLHVNRWHFRHIFQSVGSLDGMSELGRRYVGKCLGHRVPDSFWRTSPFFCVLVAREFAGGRWRGVEDVILSSGAASYFYAKLVVGGRLPWELHGQLGLRSFSGLDYGLRRYFSEFAQV